MSSVFVLAQLNFTVGDFTGNLQKIRQVLVDAGDVDWVVFTELALSGYYPMDLLNLPAFQAAYDEAVRALCALSETTTARIVVGAVTRNDGKGKPFHNSLLVVHRGKVSLRYHKQLLPTYDVFDEYRHFEPGPVEQSGVWREQGQPVVGFLVCEDIWNMEQGDYVHDPVSHLFSHHPDIDILVSIHASPANECKVDTRHAMLSQLAARHGASVVYVNQVGGADALVFDGASMVVNRHGALVARAPSYEESVQRVKHDHGRWTNAQPMAPVLTGPALWHRHLVLGLRDYFRKTGPGFGKALVGSSGGIDSAVVLVLAAHALGPENVIALTMPSTYSSEGSVADSQDLCRRLGVVLHQVPIQGMVDAFQSTMTNVGLGPWSGLALENAQARARAVTLMGWANQWGALVLTTGNKSEVATGYGTLYGDMAGAINPLGDLYKTEVYALAEWLNEQAIRTTGEEIIPSVILTKAPSAELAPGQKDEDSLPPYPVLDAILRFVIEGDVLEEAQYAQALAVVQAHPVQYEDMLKKLQAAEFKRRQAPPILRVHQRAFGAGWQVPLAQQFKDWKYHG